MKSLIWVAVSRFIGIAGTEVWACGDSLYRVGKGISYRVYTAPSPGQTYDEVLLAERDEIKDYLKGIHKTLKSKAS